MHNSSVREQGHKSHLSMLGKNSTVLLLLLLLLSSGTYGAYRSISSWTKEAIRTEFDSTVQNVSHLLEMSMEDVQGIMMGAKGLYDSSKTVERDGWHTYFKATDIAEKHPELYGIGYVERVSNQDKALFIENVRRDTSTSPAGYPDFTIFPESQKDEYFVLKFVEPASLEEKAMGFDVSSDAVRLRTLQKARETGEMAMTPFITLVTGARGPTLYLPFYQKGVPLKTLEERKRGIAGFIVSGLSVPQFFQGIFHPFIFPKGFSIHIHQRSADGKRGIPFYDSITGSNTLAREIRPLYQKTDTLQFGGQTWEIESIATSAFKRSTQLLPSIILFGGSAISLLVFGIVIFIFVSSARTIQKERKNAQDLHTLNVFLDSIIENIPHMIFVKDAKELRFVRFNKAGEELLGYRRSEMIGKNDFDFFPKEEADFFMEKDRGILQRGEILDIPMESIKTRQKGECLLHTKKIPLLGDDGKPRYLLGISEDITERQREEQAKAEFVSLVSHQLRTPLAAMRWSFEILKERISHFSDTERRLMNQSYTAMLNMAQTINTMLAVAHIDTRKIVISLSEFSLSGMLKSLIHEFEIESTNKHVQLTFESPDDYWITCDANLLREIFSNLLSNAIQYTPDGGRVIVSAGRDGQQAVISVTDTGIGIPENAMGSIFERLFRAENAKKIKASGSGLGLYVVRSLTALLGGKVSVTSKKGEGTTFVVRLPLIAPS